MNDKLNALRIKAGISQTTLAIQAGMNPAAFNRIERGVRPNKNTAEKIAKALNVKPSDLFNDYASLRAY